MRKLDGGGYVLKYHRKIKIVPAGGSRSWQVRIGRLLSPEFPTRREALGWAQQHYEPTYLRRLLAEGADPEARQLAEGYCRGDGDCMLLLLDRLEELGEEAIRRKVRWAAWRDGWRDTRDHGGAASQAGG